MEELTAGPMRPGPKRPRGSVRRTGHMGPQLEEQTGREIGTVNQMDIGQLISSKT